MQTNEAIWDFTGGFSFDYGDAPDSYGAAMHLVDGSTAPAVQLGSVAPDNEPYSLNSSIGSTNGEGDNQNSTNDEDGISNFPVITAGDIAYQLAVSCNTGFVSAWIDFNLNGKFDFNERNSNYPTNCAGSNTQLLWNNITIANGGDSFVRVRAAQTAQSIYKPTGFIDNGEVEDYSLPIIDIASTSGSCPAGTVSHVYDYNNPPITYSGNQVNPTVATINVPDSFTVEDVNVLNISASQGTTQSLYFGLSKGGQTAYLFGNACWNTTGLFFSLDDESNTTVSCPIQGGQTFQPFGSLSDLDGQDANGVWELRVYNYQATNSGRVDDWALELCEAANTNNGGGEPASDVLIAKSVSVNQNNATFTLQVLNTSEASIENIVITDNLDNVFGAGNYAVTSVPVIVSAPGNDFFISSNYTGEATASNIAFSGGELQAGEVIEVAFTVSVLPSAVNSGTFTNQASVEALSETGEVVTDLSGTGLGADSDDPTQFVLTAEVFLTGTVFIDTSNTASTSHDGVQQTNELGLSGAVVRVMDVASNSEIASAITANDGSWFVNLDASQIGQPVEVVVTASSVFQSISESPNSTTPVSDGRVQITLNSDSNLNVVDFGVINKPSLTQNHSENVSAGNIQNYFHEYTVPTHGNLDFSFTTVNSSPSHNWQETLYRDVNCDSIVDTNDFIISGPLAVNYQDQVCVALSIEVPLNVVAGASQAAELVASLYVSDPAQTGHSVIFQNANTDVSNVISQGVGNLVLDKSVVNITLGGSPVDQNQALPGHILEYQINYSNTGNGNILDLQVNDEAPAFTQIEPASAICQSTPSQLTCSPNTVGAQVTWNFQGVLPPGESGQVSYRIQID